ncbi:MAG: TMEM165/GDT1 family protein [Pseudomonadales bacterium]
MPASPEFISVAASSFSLIALAEFGDKSQLVCMTLAMRHRHLPVMLGAAIAFVLLNALAVLFGVGVAAWVPERLTAGVVAAIFIVFGVLTWRNADHAATDGLPEVPKHGVFLTTLLLIFAAEFGDKTQIAVAALAGTLPPLPVWVGATAALIAVSALGIWAGRTLLRRVPLRWLHRAAAIMFLGFGVLAGWRVVL